MFVFKGFLSDEICNRKINKYERQCWLYAYSQLTRRKVEADNIPKFKAFKVSAFCDRMIIM